MPHTKSFLAFLRNINLISDKEENQLQKITQEKQESPLSVALRTGMLPEHTLIDAFSQYTTWPIITLSELKNQESTIATTIQNFQTKISWWQNEKIIPWIEGETVVCCTCDIPGITAKEFIQNKADKQHLTIQWKISKTTDIEHLYSTLNNQKEQAFIATGDIAHLRELAEEGPIVELVNSLLSQSVTHRASDIHIEPGEYGFVARVRVDGIMRNLQTFSADRFDATVCRIKILSQLDIAERRLPQDGRMTARIHGETFDVRVSILPGSNGESVVMRLLRQDRPNYNLGDLGMLHDHATLFNEWIEKPNGIILVTGPTGSGKTTTLYTALDLGNNGLKKIITIEDPVEYKLHGITQLQVNADIGYTFASALRSILRHDPDVILIGEIRDQETAAIAVQSALTGHLVFSTLHTNSAAGAISRLSDMGIEKFLLASSLRGIMAQRLVRRLCPHCSRPASTQQASQQAILQEMHTIWQKTNQNQDQKIELREPVGCEKCLHSGYLGRIAVYEMFDVDDALRHEILNQTSETKIIEHLRARNIRSMTQDGYLKACSGITTLAEVISVG